MNLDDGRVSIVAEATRDAIDSLVRELERGPRLGKVERVDVSWRLARGEFGEFDIRYRGRNA